MKLRDARIGYAGYSRDFSVPGDRRRLSAYAQIKNIPIEYAELGRDYDVAYVTYSSDLPGWIARKRRYGGRMKLVFELIDAYFTETGLTRRLLKGSGRFVLGIDSRLSPDLRRTLIGACEAADAVVCSTEEQQETIRRYNPNVFLSFDYFAGELGPPKNNYARSGKLRIVWEGQSTTLPNVRAIRDPLNDLRENVELHVVTDPTIYRYFGRFGSYPAMEALEEIECDKHFHRWDGKRFTRDITACDVAIIPIEASNALWWGKPENKLVLLWQLGMPVLATATPVYNRVMAAAGVDLTCESASSWGEQLERVTNWNSAELGKIGRKCRQYATTAYSAQEFVDRFDTVFASIGLGTD